MAGPLDDFRTMDRLSGEIESLSNAYAGLKTKITRIYNDIEAKNTAVQADGTLDVAVQAEVQAMRDAVKPGLVAHVAALAD